MSWSGDVCTIQWTMGRVLRETSLTGPRSFFIKTEVSAQYLQCLCNCLNLIQPEWNIKTLLVLNTDELKDFYSPYWTRHKTFEILPSSGGCTEQLLVIKSKGQVIRATFSHNLSRNIVALQVEKRCCPYYHPRSQLVTQQISMLQVVAICCAK